MTAHLSPMIADLITRLEAEAVAKRHAGLLLYRKGRRDEVALQLLDAADANWRIVRELRHAERAQGRQAAKTAPNGK
jgi:hypothetical protein